MRTIGCGEIKSIANEGVLRGSVLSFLVFGGGIERKQVELLRGKTIVEQGVQTDVAMVIDVVFLSTEDVIQPIPPLGKVCVGGGLQAKC